MSEDLIKRLDSLSAPHLADACVRVNVPVRCAPGDIQAIDPSMHCAGRVRPARHVGSVDVFMEALEGAEPRDVLVIDDSNRRDRACIGDMVTREVKMAGFSGIIIWGCHRDTNELLEIGLPVFSLGKIPTGALSVDRRSPDALEWARIGEWIVSNDDVAVGDCDGVIFLPYDKLDEIVPVAEAIRDREKEQAAAMAQGKSLRELLWF